jgi:hypothetical protein
MSLNIATNQGAAFAIAKLRDHPDVGV